MKRLVAGILCCCLATFLTGCGSDKGTNPKTGLVGQWPAEATGRYVLKMEIKYCDQGPFAGCNWLDNWTDTTDICGDPVMAYFLRDPSIEFVELDGLSSDSIYDVTATIQFVGGCQKSYHFSSSESGMPPSKAGWQFLRESVGMQGCPPDAELDPAMYRYTYTRIGDADCSGGEQ